MPDPTAARADVPGVQVRPRYGMRAAPAPTAGPILAASYGRKSTKDREGLEAQFLANQHKAAEEGYSIPASPDFRFEDDDTTGTTKSRRGFDRLIARVSAGDVPFKRLYIKDKTRLGRWDDPRYHSYLEIFFQQHGVQVRYAEDSEGPIDYENGDPSQILGRHLKDQVDNAGAAQERRRLRRRVTGGMRKRVFDGFYPGSRAPYGMRRTLVNTLTKEVVRDVPQLGTIRMSDCHFGLRWADDGTLEVVVRIFELAEQGWSLRRIAQHLNHEGLASPLVARGEHRRYRRKLPTGEWVLVPASSLDHSAGEVNDAAGATSKVGPPAARPWLASAVADILRNPIYCGDLVWSRTTRRQFGEPLDIRTANLDDAKEALVAFDFIANAPISRVRWMMLQEHLDDNTFAVAARRVRNPDYLLTGVVRCRDCGAPFNGFTKPQNCRRYYRHSQRSGAERREHVLACASRARYVDALALEGAVLDVFYHALEDDRLRELAEAEVERHLERGASADRQEQIRLAEGAVSALERLHRDAGCCVLEADNATSRRMYRELEAGYAAKLAAKQAELGALRGELALAEQARARLHQSGTDRLRLREAFDAATPVERKRLLQEVVESMVIDGVANTAEIVVRAS